MGSSSSGGSRDVAASTSTNKRTAPIEPRLYQRQLFERAKQGNIIACADTGVGKTLVAVLLLRWMLDQEHVRVQAAAQAGQPVRRRISVMVVSHVPLVHQQGDYVDANSSLRVVKLYGELNVDLWKEDEWDAILREYDAIVCTAQVLFAALAHAFIKLEDLNLIIFDEAHHATKSDVFARIMATSYLNATGERPKIFGMTASPVSSKDANFEKAAIELENLLDARLFTVPSEGLDSLAQATFRTRMIVREFDLTPTMEEEQYLSDSCRRILANLRASSKENHDALFKQVARLGPTLGPALMDHVLSATLDDGRLSAASLLQIRNLTPAEREDVVRSWNVGREGCMSLEKKEGKLKRAKKAYEQLVRVVREEWGLDGDGAGAGAAARDQRVSSKVKELVKVLRTVFAERSDGRGIVFVAEKMTAHVLAKFLSQPGVLEGVIVGVLVGHTGAQGQPWRTQRNILRAFRSGTTQLLIATSIVEEGLDVPACNFVVRFDLPPTPIQLIQSRGRAREKGSVMFLLMERGGGQEAELVRKLREIEEGKKSWLLRLTDDRIARVEGEEVDEDGDDDVAVHDEDGAWNEVLVSETMGARLERKDAISLLNRYVQSLPSDGFALTRVEVHFEEVPCFDGLQSGFQCTLTMPARSKLRREQSSTCRSKKGAKQQAAFRACESLFALGELDARTCLGFCRASRRRSRRR